MQPDENVNVLLKQIGDILYQARHARKEKITSVAKNIGVSHTVISKIENGKYPALSLQLLHRLVKYYKLDKEIVVSGRG